MIMTMIRILILKIQKKKNILCAIERKLTISCFSYIILRQKFFDRFYKSAVAMSYRPLLDLQEDIDLVVVEVNIDLVVLEVGLEPAFEVDWSLCLRWTGACV